MRKFWFWIGLLSVTLVSFFIPALIVGGKNQWVFALFGGAIAVICWLIEEIFRSSRYFVTFESFALFGYSIGVFVFFGIDNSELLVKFLVILFAGIALGFGIRDLVGLSRKSRSPVSD